MCERLSNRCHWQIHFFAAGAALKLFVLLSADRSARFAAHLSQLASSRKIVLLVLPRWALEIVRLHIAATVYALVAAARRFGVACVRAGCSLDGHDPELPCVVKQLST
jgi:hypothetical protein